LLVKIIAIRFDKIDSSLSKLFVHKSRIPPAFSVVSNPPIQNAKAGSRDHIKSVLSQKT